MVGIVNVVSTIAAVLLVDRVGRRVLLMVGLTGMVLSLAAMGFIFAVGTSRAGTYVLIALIVYIISFAISMGPVFWLLSAEIFPNRLRATGAGIAVTVQWAANLLVSITFLSLVNGLGPTVTFWLYGAVAILAFVFVFFLVPETKGRQLERIEGYWTHGRRWEAAERSNPEAAATAGMAQE